MRSILVALALLACGVIAEAQQAKKVHRLGFLLTPMTEAELPQSLLERLQRFGYVERQNIVVKQSNNAEELVHQKVDVIVVFGTGTALAAKKATTTIPIVMWSSANPIGNGLIASLPRPGGNVTALTSLSGELGGKRLEVLKDAVPR